MALQETEAVSIAIAPDAATPGEPPTTPPSQAAPNTNWVETYFTSPEGRKHRLAIRGLIIAAIVGVLTLQQMQFRGTWGRACDYDLKVWATVWMGRSLLQHSVVFIISSLHMANRCRSLTFNLRRLQTIIFLFKLCWFFYGIKPVLIDTPCDPVSRKWGLVLWSFEICVTIAPCVCLCLAAFFCLPLLLYCFGVESEAATATQPTPKEIRDKLKVVKYKDIKQELEARQLEPQPQQTSLGAARADEVQLLTDVASSIAGVQLPDINSLKRIPEILTRQGSERHPHTQLQPSGSGFLQPQQQQPSALVFGLQSQPSMERPQHSPTSATSATSATASGGISCPICFSQFEEKDFVIQMPCHFSHVFHDECLFSWLDHSQHCPICRGNVVESFKKEETEKEAETNEKDETVKTRHNSI